MNTFLGKLRMAIYLIASAHCFYATPTMDKQAPVAHFSNRGVSPLTTAGRAFTTAIKNFIANFGFNWNDNGSGSHSAYLIYTRCSPVGDYTSAPIGTICLQCPVSAAGAVTDAILWQKGAGGWERLNRRGRVVTKASFGSTDTQFDITITDATYGVVRYTWDTVGTDPNFENGGVQVGDYVTFAGQNFSAVNNGTFLVVTVDDDYLEVVNASGIAESNKTIGTGSIVSKVALSNDEDNVLVNYATAVTITLPTAVGCRGKQITVKSLGAGVVTLDGNASETIDGVATAALYGANEYITLVSDNANWQVIASSGYDQLICVSGAFDNQTIVAAKLKRGGAVTRVNYFTDAALGSGVGIDIVDGGAAGAGTDVIDSCSDDLNGSDVNEVTTGNVLAAATYLNVTCDNFTAETHCSILINLRVGTSV